MVPEDKGGQWKWARLMEEDVDLNPVEYVIHVPDPVFLILMLLFLMAVPVIQFLFQ
jgi:hypothetical protein